MRIKDSHVPSSGSAFDFFLMLDLSLRLQDKTLSRGTFLVHNLETFGDSKPLFRLAPRRKVQKSVVSHQMITFFP